MTRRAEIAGAGFAGLALASTLTDAGWSVRVHERSNALRTVGAGIYLFDNGLRALESLGLGDEVGACGTQLRETELLDHRGRVIAQRSLSDASRQLVVPRQALVEMLHRRAQSVGVEVLTSSPVTRLAGEDLVTADGRSWPADLTVGADGIASIVADELGVVQVRKHLETASLRFLVPGRELTPVDATREYWSGRRRLATAGCGPQHTYIWLACPEDDEAGRALPLDVATWSESFPVLEHVFARLGQLDGHRGQYGVVRCSTWSRGRVALVGDAATAQPPTLGQAGNLALANAVWLGKALSSERDVRRALRVWESAAGRRSARIQRRARLYNTIAHHLPTSLGPIKAPLMRALGMSPVRPR